MRFPFTAPRIQNPLDNLIISDYHDPMATLFRQVPQKKLRPVAASRAANRQPVLRRLLELIKRQDLAIGDRLPNIRALAAQLEVKPTLVRDALLQAQTMGLIRVLPRSGAFVQALTYGPLVEVLATTIEPAILQADHNLFHLLDARRVVEIELAGRATERRRLEDLLPVRQALDAMHRLPESGRRVDYVEADVRFHTEIARLADNSVLLMFQQALLGLLKPYLVQLPWPVERRCRTDQSHGAIYAALVAGNAERARFAMREHLDLAYQSLLHEVQALPARTSV